MPITAISLLSFWDMACSFVFDAPCQATYALAGREHGRTITLADLSRVVKTSEIPQCNTLPPQSFGRPISDQNDPVYPPSKGHQK